MKLPNGFGSVYKLSGHRRNPWCARKTVGWTYDEEKGKSYPVYKFIGYYSSRREALTALTEYNKDPYDLDHDTITFAEVYERWSEEHFQTVSASNQKGIRAAYKICGDLYDMQMSQIKLDHLQAVVDKSGKNTPSLTRAKVMFGGMWDYCVRHEILPPAKREMVRYVDVRKAGNPNSRDRTPFRKDEIDMLWTAAEHDDRYQIPIFLIYTGLRIGEFYNLRKSDISLSDHVFQVTQSKTQAGIREVPIAEKVAEIVKYRLFSSESDYLFCNTKGNRFTDRTFRDSWWTPMMKDLNMSHLPHDTRHTCVSLLAEAEVDERVIKSIVGHKGLGVTSVYTHIQRQAKIDAINKI